MHKCQSHTAIYFGDDPLARLSQLKFKRYFIVTDPFMVKSGAADTLIRRLPAGCEHAVFSHVTPDPPTDLVAEGAVQLCRFGADCLIALGGGSAIDAAKAIGYVEKHVSKRERMIYFIAVPTTSGTGSEVTSFAVITDHEQDVKHTIISEEILPREAILDVDFVKTVPPQTTADTGMDVLTHAVESYVSPMSGTYAEALAEKAVRLVFSDLLTAYHSPDDTRARAHMHAASNLAGFAFDYTSLGINHGIAHAVGGVFHIPHGRCNAVLLPHVIAYNAKNSQFAFDRYTALSRMLELGAASDYQTLKNFCNAIHALMLKMNMPTTLRACGVSEAEFREHLPSIVENALADRCTATNPVEMTADGVREILERAFE